MSESAPPPGAEALFLLGSNVGDRASNLERALGLLVESYGALTRSAFYETPPWGDADQPPFLNVAARGVARDAPLNVLRRCKEIEQRGGRTPTHQWGPREIDVDLLAYGRITLTTPDLVLPHPRLHERAFALVPLAEIAPDWRHPLLDLTVRELLTRLPPADVDAIRRAGSGER